MDKDILLLIIWSANAGLLVANLAWMIVSDISFRKRHKRLQEQIDKL